MVDENKCIKCQGNTNLHTIQAQTKAIIEENTPPMVSCVWQKVK